MPKKAKTVEKELSAEEQLAALKKENATLKAKAGKAGKKVLSTKTVKMIWAHKTLLPGTIENCFGMEGEANEDGFLLVDCPEYKVKNEMARRPKFLVPLAYYNKRKEAEANLAAEFED